MNAGGASRAASLFSFRSNIQAPRAGDLEFVDFPAVFA